MNALSWIAVVAGGLLILWSLWMFHATRRFRARCVTTIGTVVDFTTEEDSDNGARWYQPVIRFTDGAGADHQFGGGLASQQPPELGEPRSVSYDPDMPSNAWVTGSGCMWLIPVVVLVAGLAIVGAGIAIALT